MGLLLTLLRYRGDAVYVPPPPPPPSMIAAINGETVNGADKLSLHKYTGFPWVASLSDGTLVSIYKESANHAAAGDLMFGTSTGGLDYNYSQLDVTGYGPVICSNLSLGVLTGDKILISWQTDPNTSQMFFAWSDDKGVTWNYIGGITYHADADVPGNTGYYAAQFGKPVEMPSGKVLQPFYDAAVDGTSPQHAKFVEISADLTTLSVGNTISSQTGGAYPNGQHSEVFVTITDNTGVDATCKMVALQRNEQYEGFTHYHSSDGGATWVRNDSYVLNVLLDGAVDKYPVSDILYKDGLFYIIVGVRKLTDYYIGFSRVSASDLYNNVSSGYTALTRVASCYSDTNAASIDSGYPTGAVRQIPASDINEILLQWYDSNPTWNGTGEKEERIVQRAIYVGTGTYYTTPVEAKVIDDGYYNAFPFPLQLSDGRLISIYKKAGDHASKGPMTIATSLDGGTTWSEHQIHIGATAIECAALSVGLLEDDRILIGYQDDETYTSLKFAYSNDRGTTWTASASVLTNGTGLSFSPVKMRVLPSGKILCGYYTGYGAGENAEIGFCVSTNNGSTWSFGPTIFSHAGTGFGDNKGYEFGFDIVENTGYDSTSKLIALVRNADQTPYMHYKSSDGGTTWSTDLVTNDTAPGGPYSRHYLYTFGAYSSSAPCDITTVNGVVYVLTGYRDAGAGNSYAIKYITASVTDAYNNNYNGWTSPVTVLTSAQNNVHFGYPLFVKIKSNEVDNSPTLWAHYYDVSELTNNGLGSPRCFVKQVEILAP